jgi:mannose-1-phosphate guanylyltransferase
MMAGAKAVLLVGGLGTRLRPLTYVEPKALIPVANRPLISYTLRMLRRGGVQEAILATGYRAERLREAFEGERADGLRVRCVEERERLDTAGGIRNALPEAEAPFIAMNGDQLLDVDVRALLEAHAAHEADLTIVVRQVPDVSAFGLVLCDAEGRIEGFLEKRPEDPTGRDLVNAGMYVLSPSALAAIPPGRPWSNERNLFPDLVKSGARCRAFGMEKTAYWADVGTPRSYLDANRAVLNGALPWADPPTHPEQACDIAPGARVEPGARLGPNVAAGPEAVVEAGAEVADAILWPGARVSRGCRLANAIVGPGHVVAPETTCAGEEVRILADPYPETSDG